MATVTQKPRYQNKHNIYVKTGVATYEQFAGAVAEYKKLLATHPDPEIRKLSNVDIEVNLVTDGGNRSQMFGYLWVSKEPVYWLLVGNNPDGSERVEEESSSDGNELNLDDIDFANADLNALTDSFNEKVKPKIIRNLGPLIPFPSYAYTPEQAENVYKYESEEEAKAASVERRDPRPVVKQSRGYFQLSRSVSIELDPDVKSNILRGEIPTWVTGEMIFNSFYKFASNNGTVKTEYKNHKKTVMMEGPHKCMVYTFEGNPWFKFKIYDKPVPWNPKYVVVHIEYINSVYATGIFAIQMRRKTTFKNTNPAPGDPKEAVCIFNYLKDKTQHSAGSGDSSSPGKRYGSSYNNSPNGSFNRFSGGGGAAGGAGSPSTFDDNSFTMVRRK